MGYARKQVVQAAFYFSDDPQSTVVNLSYFSNRLQPQNPLQSAPSPVGEGWGEGILPNRGNLSQHPNRPNTSLAACCPFSNSLPRERGRVAVGIKGSARKISCAGCFLLFRRPEINGCKFKLLFKPPATVKPAATYSLPRGGRLGRGHFPNFGNLSRHPKRPNTSLAACCSLSLALSRGRENGVAVGIKGSARKTGVQIAFCFSDDLQSTPAYSSCFSNCLKP